MMYSIVKSLRFFLPVLFVSLYSCKTNKEPKPVVLSMDSLAIALDTTMQLGIERSYEYHQSIAANSELVYDIVGFGGSASKGEFAILQRGADNKTDTIIKGVRTGSISNSFLADLNGNKIPEIYLAIKKIGDGSLTIIAFEIDREKYIPVSFNQSNEQGYRGRDSVYVSGNKIYSVFPVYNGGDSICCPTGGTSKVSYSLQNGGLYKSGSE